MFTKEKGLFSKATKDLIFDFNQYNHIPLMISNTYVRFVLNYDRIRQKTTHTPSIIFIDSSGIAGIFSKDAVGNKTHLSEI